MRRPRWFHCITWAGHLQSVRGSVRLIEPFSGSASAQKRFLCRPTRGSFLTEMSKATPRGDCVCAVSPTWINRLYTLHKHKPLLYGDSDFCHRLADLFHGLLASKQPVAVVLRSCPSETLKPFGSARPSVLCPSLLARSFHGINSPGLSSAPASSTTSGLRFASLSLLRTRAVTSASNALVSQGTRTNTGFALPSVMSHACPGFIAIERTSLADD